MAYILFFIINILYISFELLFNFTLLNVVSNVNTSPTDIQDIENIGRFLSASGFTLLCWKLIYSNEINKKWNSSIIIGAIITLAVFFSFYKIQDKYIDHLARSFTNETKQNIYDIYLLKKGLLTGSVSLQNIPYNTTLADTAESKTFITGLPLFLAHNDKMLSYIRDNREKLTSHIYANDLRENTHIYSPIYEKVYGITDQFYVKYLATTKSMISGMQSASTTGENSYSKMHKQLQKKYKYTRTRLSYSSWINTPEIKQLISNTVYSQYKLRITKDFNPMNKISYKNALIYSVQSNYTDSFNSKLSSEKDFPKVPLGILDKDIFYKHPEMISFLKRNLGSLYFESPALNKYSFRSNERRREDKILINNNSANIGKSIAKEHISKNLNSEEIHSIIKGMIVPPIALILSIFFAFINFILLIKELSFKIFTKFNKSPKMYSNIIMYYFVFLLLTLPLIISNSYTEKDSYKRVYSTMEDNSKIIAFCSDWILRFEPFVYNYAEVAYLNNLKENKNYRRFFSN